MLPSMGTRQALALCLPLAVAFVLKRSCLLLPFLALAGVAPGAQFPTHGDKLTLKAGVRAAL